MLLTLLIDQSLNKVFPINLQYTNKYGKPKRESMIMKPKRESISLCWQI